MNVQKLFLCGFVLGYTSLTHADQPIMNMMPRWDRGFGLQVQQQYIHRSDIFTDNRIAFTGFSEEIHQVWLEGVYTWDRSVRITFKLPYVIDARRELPGITPGSKVEQHDEGLGDLTLALPLKKYFNLNARSGNWTVSPQLRIPLDDRGEDNYDVWNRVWGVGLSFGYETETPTLFFSIGAGFWVFEEPENVEMSASLDLGWNFRDNAQLLWESDVKWQDDSTLFISAGPALYWRLADQIHGRIEWKHDFHSEVGYNELDHGNGDMLRVGLGFVY